MNSKLDNKIEIHLKEREDYENTFNSERISRDLAEYIINETKTIGLKEDIIIEITTDFKLSDEEKSKLSKMIKLSFEDEIIELKIYEKNSNKQNLYFMFFGILILFIYFLFRNTIIISEFLLIIGWLLLWETIYSFIFSSTENKITLIKRKQLVNSKIVFKD